MIHGETKPKEDKIVIEGLEKGDFSVIVATT
jgi:RecG-like helicase